MALVARWQGRQPAPRPQGPGSPRLFLGFTQFCVNFNAVYLAERHITSGVVATVFALLLIPASLLGWALLGQRPSRRFAWSSLVAVAGIVLLFVHELHEHPASARPDRRRDRPDPGRDAWRGDRQCRAGAARDPPIPLFALLAWSMAAGAAIDGLVRLRPDRSAGVRPAAELLARVSSISRCSPRC